MKRLVLSVMAVAVMFAARAGVVYVASDGAGDGSSWESATTFEAALGAAASATEPVELRVKQGQYIIAAKIVATVGQPLTIRGGYTGEDETTQGGVTSFDANFEAVAGILSLTMNADLEIDSCDFVNCRPNSACTAVALTGTSSCNLTLNNCSISGNQRTSSNGNNGGMRGLKISTFATATITGCAFNCNGYTQSVTSGFNHQGADGVRGVGLWVSNARTTMQNCRVSGNKYVCHCNNAHAVYFDGNGCDGSVVKNCAIVGNLGMRSDNDAGKAGTNVDEGAVTVNIGANKTIAFENCTIAYNSILEYVSTPGLRVTSGTATVKNTIFYANIGAGSAGEASKQPADVFAATGTSVTMLYCWTRGTGTAYVSGNVVQQNSLTGDNPGFVSTLEDYNDAVNLNVTKLPYSTKTSPNFKTSAEDAVALDVHLLSKAGRWNGTAWVTDETSSGLLDMGDPASDFVNEPDYNGGAINLGAYGNTAEASKSQKATPVFTETVDATGDYTMPHDAVVCGGDGIYHCDVYFCWGADGTADSLASWENKVLCKSDAKPGDTIDVRPMQYFDQGTELRWAVLFVEKDGTAVETASEIRTTVLAQPTPPWYGKGGGARVLHVRPGATGKKDGTSWTDAIETYDEAMTILKTRAADYDEVWFAGDQTTGQGCAEALVLPGAFAFRGGFTGAEDTPVERLADGSKAMIDGQTYAYYLLNFKNEAGAVTVDRLTLTHAYRRSLVKTGAGDLTLRDSRFTDNYSAYDNTGRGACVTGSSTTMLTIEGCLFDQNRYTGTETHGNNGNNYANGAGLYASTFAHIDLSDTVFRQNGLARSVRTARADFCSSGVGAYIVNAPVTANRVEFRNNLGCHHSQHASAMYLGGSSSGSAFTNCLWVGNCMMACDHPAGLTDGKNGAGAIVVNLANKNSTVGFQNCTIAYNVVVSAYAPGGMNVKTGTMRMRDSILWGNVTVYQENTQNQLAPADLYVSTANGYADLDWCCIADPTSVAYITQDTARIKMGANMTTGDPLFATSTDTFRSLILPGVSANVPVMNACAGWVSLSDDVDAGLDVHLLSQDGRYLDGAWMNDAVGSPALNAANPESDYTDEPAPNGGRANLGAYGNTAEASKAAETVPELGEVTLDLAVDYTMPHASVVCGGSGIYSANVYFCYGDEPSEGEGTNGWASVVFSGTGHCQDVIDASPRAYLEPNSTIYWRVVMMDALTGVVYGTSDVATATAGNEVAPWYLKSGGANVIHVRPGATGKATGLNWTDAYTTYAEAIANVSAARNEIWIAGDIVWPSSTAGSLTLGAPLAIRGGFAGYETMSAERAKGAQTKIDSRTMYRMFWFVSDSPLVFDGFDIDGSSTCIFQKSGKGDLTLVNSKFRNSLASGEHNGVTLDGGKTGKLTISGCSFEGCQSTSLDKGVNRPAHGLKAANFTSVTVDDSLFASNGFTRAKHESWFDVSDGTQGSGAWFVGNGPVVIRGSRFIDNTWACHCGAGSALWIDSSPSAALTNCLFAGNCGIYSDSENKGYTHYGAAVARLAADDSPFDVVNCTFAFNKSQEGSSPVALGIMKGRGNILNSIFYCNVQPAPAVPVDVCARTPSFIDYCWVMNTNTTYISGANMLTQGEHMIVGVEHGREPFFVMSTNDFKQVTGIGLGVMPKSTGNTYFADTIDTTDWINVHLRGKYGYTDEVTGEKTVVPMPAEQLALKVKQSPCIDAGDPATSCRKEAKPNGRVVNLGYYGNTPWASRSAGQGFAIILR